MHALVSMVYSVTLLTIAGALNLARGQGLLDSLEESTANANDSHSSVVDTSAHTNSASNLASALMMSFDIVVLGEFEPIPADLEKDPLKARMVSVTFVVSHSYKGSEPGPMEIELMSDMLVYPGEEVSRYVKRIDMRKSLGQSLRDTRAELEALKLSLASGAISNQQFETESSEKANEKDELLRQRNGLGSRRATSIDMESYYDRGGVIRPGIPYLVGLDRHGILDELPINTNIYWGSMMEEILSVLNE